MLSAFAEFSVACVVASDIIPTFICFLAPYKLLKAASAVPHAEFEFSASETRQI